MSKFYEKVGTPETQLRRSKAPSGPNIDPNARQEAQNEYNTSLGKAITDFVGTVGNVVQGVEEGNRVKKAKMITEHALDAREDTSDYGSNIKGDVDSRAKEKYGKGLDDLTKDELIELTNASDQDYLSKFKDKPYYELIKDEVKRKHTAFIETQVRKNKETLKNKRLETLNKEASTIFENVSDPQTAVGELKKLLDANVGTQPIVINGEEITPAINDTQQNAKLGMFQRFMQAAVYNRNTKALELLKSKEMEEFFNFPDYKNAMNILEKQTRSKANANRQMSLDKAEEEYFLGSESGAFSTAEEVESWFKDKFDNMPEAEKPDAKDILKFKEKALEAFQEQMTYESVYSRVKSGDYTFMERTNLKKKQRDQFSNKMFQDETGISDLSPQGIEYAVLSGDNDAAIKSYFNRFGTVPPALSLYGKTAPSGSIEGLKQKRNVFAAMSVLVEGTPVSLENIYTPDEQTRMLYIGRLLDDAEDGVISEADVSQAYRNFNNDVKKNRDSFGNYVSPIAQEYLADEDTQEWLTENVKDAAWTTDEQSAQGYRRRQLVHYFNLAMETTDDPEVARQKAEKMFMGRHRDVEAPNGEETVLPSEYMGYQVKDFVKLAKNHPDFEPFRALGYLGTSLGSDTYFENSISFTPDTNYEKNKVMNIYYGEGEDKKLVMSVTPKLFDNILGSINERIVEEAKERRRKRLENPENNPSLDKATTLLNSVNN